VFLFNSYSANGIQKDAMPFGGVVKHRMIFILQALQMVAMLMEEVARLLASQQLSYGPFRTLGRDWRHSSGDGDRAHSSVFWHI
jgi:hypothetical protein